MSIERVKLIGGQQNGQWIDMSIYSDYIQFEKLTETSFAALARMLDAGSDEPVCREVETYHRKVLFIGAKEYRNLFFLDGLDAMKWMQDLFDKAINTANEKGVYVK